MLNPNQIETILMRLVLICAWIIRICILTLVCRLNESTKPWCQKITIIK